LFTNKTCTAGQDVFFCDGALANSVVLSGAEGAAVDVWGGAEE